MTQSRQDLKPIWLKCLKGKFKEAEKEGKGYIKIQASILFKMGKLMYPDRKLYRPRSICYAMNSIKGKEDTYVDGKIDHMDYTIKYILPKSIEVGSTIPDDSEEVGNVEKPEKYE